MTRRNIVLFGLVPVLAAGTAAAAPLDVKLGLWETTSITHMSGIPIPADALANMPPAQRAKLEAMMSARQAQPGRNHTSKSCVTQADLDRPFQSPERAAEKCTQTVVNSSATQAEYKIQCSGSSAHQGVMHIEALSREQVKESFTMNAGNGTVSSEGSSRWLSADCGTVKPRQ